MMDILRLRTENHCNNRDRYSPVYFCLLILLVNGSNCFSLEVVLVSWRQMGRLYVTSSSGWAQSQILWGQGGGVWAIFAISHTRGSMLLESPPSYKSHLTTSESALEGQESKESANCLYLFLRGGDIHHFLFIIKRLKQIPWSCLT